MLARNDTPFAALAFEQVHRDGYSMAVIVARGIYALSKSGELTLAGEQKLVLADEYEGDPHETPLVRVGDLIPFKPKADITVIGAAYPPGGEPSARWRSGIKVADHAYLLRVHGNRVWEPTAPAAPARSWRLGQAGAIGHASLDYRHAAGGPVIGDPMRGESRFNPRGGGILHPEHTPAETRLTAPVIDSEEQPVTDPFAEPEPQGTAPIPPFWRFRRQYAGTYDEAWKRHRHPQLPEDFDYRFYQTAHPKLIYPGYLRGDEPVKLAGLVPGGGRLDFDLPFVLPYAHFVWTDGRHEWARLNLDGLHLDLRGDPPWRVDLTWRAWHAICPRFFKIDLFLATLGDPGLTDLLHSTEDGLVRPRPRAADEAATEGMDREQGP